MPEAYHAIFPPLLTPTFWERSGNVPALVRLLAAYLARAGGDVATRGYLQAVLGVFQKLVASKAHDHEGFSILNTLIEHVDYEGVMAQVGGGGGRPQQDGRAGLRLLLLQLLLRRRCCIVCRCFSLAA